MSVNLRLTSTTYQSITINYTYHARFGYILEYKLPDGRGVRFTIDGKKFIGFIE